MPVPSNVLQRPDLGAMAYEAINNNDDYIGLKVMPVFITPWQASDYPIITTESMLKRHDTKRQAKSNFARDDYNFTTGTYSCKENGWEEVIDDVERKLYKRLFNAEVVALERATQIILSAVERDISAVVSGNTGSTTAAAAGWGNPATATPRADVTAAKIAQRNAGGVVGDTLVLSWLDWNNLIATDELKTYMSFTSPHLLQGEAAMRDTVARYLGVNQVLVAGAIQDTANKAKASVIGSIWGTGTAYLVKVSSGGQNLKEPSFGRTFMWNEISSYIITVETYRDDAVASDVVRVRNFVDPAVQYVNANHSITGI